MQKKLTFSFSAFVLLEAMWLSAIAAAQFSSGDSLMPRLGCKITRTGSEVEEQQISLPLKILSSEEDLITTDSGVVHKQDVVPLKSACRYYSEILADSPHHAYALRHRAISAAILGRLDEGLADALKAVDIDPESPVTLKTYADILYKNKRYSDAITNYRRAVELSPQFASAYMNYAIALNKAREYEAAISALKCLVGIDATRHDAWALMGELFGKLGRRDRAIRSLDKAIVFREEPSYRHVRSMLHMMVGEYQQSLDDANATIKLRGNRPSAYLIRTYALIKLQKLDDARDQIDRMMQRPSLMPYALKFHPYLLSSLGQQEAVASALESRVKLLPDDGAANIEMSLFLSTQIDSRLRNGDSAVVYAKKALELSERRKFAPLIALAAANAEVGRFDDAVRFQREAIKSLDMCLNTLHEQRVSLIKKIVAEEPGDRAGEFVFDAALPRVEATCNETNWKIDLPIHRLSLLNAETGNLSVAIELQDSLRRLYREALIETMKEHLVLYENKQPQRYESGNFFWDKQDVLEWLDSSIGLQSPDETSEIGDK